MINTLDILFPDSIHILCTWHVNMNILANYQKYFSANKRHNNAITPDPQWEMFLKDWNIMLESTSESKYGTHLAHFCKYPKAAIDYVINTWLNSWKEKLVSFWVDQNLYFGIRVTSLIEGYHAQLKVYLKASIGGVKGVFDHHIMFWPNQQQAIALCFCTKIDSS
jgi:hypothetical protein